MRNFSTCSYLPPEIVSATTNDAKHVMHTR
jgi:hypothetical protein